MDKRRLTVTQAEGKILLSDTVSHHQVGRWLASSQNPLNSEDLLVIAPLNLLITIFSITLSPRKLGLTTQGMKEGWRESRR